MNQIRIDGYRRINKSVARRLYNAGEDVLFCPCKMRPLSTWGLGIIENKDNWGNKDIPFDTLVDNYIWYNCGNETGKYVAFYIKEA